MDCRDPRDPVRDCRDPRDDQDPYEIPRILEFPEIYMIFRKIIQLLLLPIAKFYLTCIIKKIKIYMLFGMFIFVSMRHQ